MTLDELKAKVQPLLKEEALKDEKVWGEVASSIEAVVNANTLGVVNNKETILKEKKELEKQFKELEAKLKPYSDNNLSVEQVLKMKQELELLKASGTATPEEIKSLQQKFYEQGKAQQKLEIEPQLNEFKNKVGLYEGQVKELSEKYRKKLTEVEVARTLQDLRVTPDNFWLTGFMASAKAEYLEAEDRMSISVPNPIDPNGPYIPLNDWAKIFPQTEAGKKMIPAPQNSGTGAYGSSSKGGSKVSLADTVNAMFAKR